MKQYENENPSFSEKIEILETTDTNHADNFNVATKKLYENTMVLKKEQEQTSEAIEDLQKEVEKMGDFSYDEENQRLVIPATIGSVVDETLILTY